MANEIELTKNVMTADEKRIIKMFDAEIEKVNAGRASIGKTLDTFSNIGARIGFGTESQNEGAEYLLTRLTYNYQVLTALFRNSWIVQKGVTIPARDMNKLGVNISSELDPDKLEKVYKKLDSQNTKMIEGTQWGRLYGGSIGIMLIKDMMNKKVLTKDGKETPVIELPLELEDIDVGSFSGIYIIDRWNGVSPISTELETDITSYRYGEPKYYTVNLPNKQSVRFHHSWILIFEGINLPRIEKQAETWWGMTVLEPVFRELQKRDNTNYSIANLIFQQSIRVFKFKDFKMMTSNGSKAFQEEFALRMEALVKKQGNQTATVIDADDSFEIQNQTYSGLDSILELFMEDIAGAFNVPMDRMYGRPGKGFSGDDKSSARNYSNFIHNEQEAGLRHNYEKLIKVICKSELGEVPNDLTFEFILHYDVDADNRKSRLEDTLSQIATAFENGGITRSVYLKELREAGRDFNMFTNITDEEIAEAEKNEKLSDGDTDLNEEKYDIDEEEKTKDGGFFGRFSRKNKSN